SLITAATARVCMLGYIQLSKKGDPITIAGGDLLDGNPLKDEPIAVQCVVVSGGLVGTAIFHECYQKSLLRRRGRRKKDTGGGNQSRHQHKAFPRLAQIGEELRIQEAIKA